MPPWFEDALGRRVLTIRYDKSVGKLVRIMWIPVLATALYTGWVFWQRHTSQASVPRQPVETDPLAKYGNKVKILDFYSSKAPIAPGANARAVLRRGER